MTDRLKDLQRQRTLALEQLAWIDREIARETGPAPAPVPSAALVAPPTPVVIPAATPAGVTPEAAARTAEEILARFQPTTESTTRDVKKGCYLYFIFALGALLLFAAGAYFIYVNLQ